MQVGGRPLCFNVDDVNRMIDSHPAVVKSDMREPCSWSLLWVALGNVREQKASTSKWWWLGT